MNGLFWAIAAAMGVGASVLLFMPIATDVGKKSRVVMIAALLVPALALTVYAVLGTPDATTMHSGSSTSPGGRTGSSAMTGNPNSKVGSVDSLLEGLEKRLESEPEDGGSWLLLAKSYQHLGRIEDAKLAYAKAVALGKEDPGFAQLLIGESASGRGASEVAVANSSIRGTISIDPEAAKQVEPAATVFVFAKAVNGSPMPLAVVRKSVSELPFDFVIDDSMAMVAGMTISSVPEVVVSAKISSTGNAMQPDVGLEANSGPITVGRSADLNLQITRTN